MKNITVRGFSTFIKTLRKHILAGTYMNFWKEVHSKSRALVHANYTLAGTSYKIIYMNELINKMIELMPEISEQEMLDVISKVIRISFLYEDRYWFLLSVNDSNKEISVASSATIEAEKATDVLTEEDNPVQQATDSLESAKEITAELAGTLSDEDKATFVEAISREDELKALTIKELREILKARDVKFAFAAKEAKLIELVIASDNS